MSQMQELYEKVSQDPALLAKFGQILARSRQEDGKQLGDQLIAFARDAGFEIGFDEMQVFFSRQADQSASELSEAELDMVAGGKSTEETVRDIALSITIMGCVVMRSIHQNSMEGFCEI